MGIFKIIIFSLTLFWELPQNIMGALLYLTNSFRIKKVEYFKNYIVIYVFKFYPGCSLGRFLFLMYDPENRYKYNYKGKIRTSKDLLLHEYGHAIQSEITGWLYSFIILIPF